MDILLIHDKTSERETLESLIRSYGHHATVQAEFQEALTSLQNGAYDIALVDISTAGLKEAEFCRRIRAHCTAEETMILAMTPLHAPVELEPLLESGVDDYLVKPIEERLLRATLKVAEQRLRGLRLQRKTAQSLQKSHQQLKRVELQYEAVLRSTPHGLCMLSADWRIEYLNHAMSRILEPDVKLTQDLISLPFSVLFPAEDAFQAYRQSAVDKVRKEGVDIREMELRRTDGSPFWCEISVVRHDPASTAPGFVATISDITERKRLADEQTQLRSQLLQAQKMEAIGRLAGGVSHDFNNLLTTIIGRTQLLMMEIAQDDPRREEVDEIHRAADRAASLTRQLLAFSRRQALRPINLSLNQSISNLEKMLRRLLGENIELQTRLDPTLGQIKADPGQIEEIIVNLTLNAADAMPNGGVLSMETANVRLDRQSPLLAAGSATPGHYVQLTVRDTGYGMDEETQKRIFEPFFTTKDSGEGSGLGLSTVYGIVKQSGGHISVKSAPGEGAAMHILLPRADQAREDLNESRAADSRSPRLREKILLVEDEEGVRKLTYEALQSLGYEVITAADGAEGLEMADQHGDSINLILTDVVLPHLSGPDMARKIKAKRPDVVVLFMSGYLDHASVKEGGLLSGVGFLQKPFTIAALTREVASALQK